MIRNVGLTVLHCFARLPYLERIDALLDRRTGKRA